MLKAVLQYEMSEMGILSKKVLKRERKCCKNIA